MRYLNPRADLTFKKVFGQHPDIVKSFLNALLPFHTPEEEIAELEYITPEMVPDTPLHKDSIVDVRCRDGRGRQFIVEMQMLWTSHYKQRVLFNASKAYVGQLDRGRDYDLLQPVYSLNLVDDTYSASPEYYHDYEIVERADTREVIEGLRFIFIELPKFTPKHYGDKRMQVLWLRYLTEINEQNRPTRRRRSSWTTPRLAARWNSCAPRHSPPHRCSATTASGTASAQPRCSSPTHETKACSKASRQPTARTPAP